MFLPYHTGIPDKSPIMNSQVSRMQIFSSHTRQTNISASYEIILSTDHNSVVSKLHGETQGSPSRPLRPDMIRYPEKYPFYTPNNGPTGTVITFHNCLSPSVFIFYTQSRLP